MVVVPTEGLVPFSRRQVDANVGEEGGAADAIGCTFPPTVLGTGVRERVT